MHDPRPIPGSSGGSYRDLEEQVTRRTVELETLLSLQQAIVRRREPEAVLQLVIDEARNLTGSARGLIFVVRGEEVEVAVTSGEARAGMPTPDLVRGFRMPIDGSLTGRAIRDGRALRTEDTSSDARVNRAIIDQTGAENLLIVPMEVEGRPLGAIVVADKEAGSFGDDDERLLMMLASGAAIALENARLYQEELDRRREAEGRRRVAEGLRDILAALNSLRPLNDVLDVILQQAGELLGAGAAAVYRLNPQEGMLYIQRAQGLPEDYVDVMLVGVGHGGVGVAVQERRLVVVSGAQFLDPEAFEVAELVPHLVWLDEHFRTIVAVPLMIGDRVYGGLTLYYPETREFSDEELALAATFADHASLALENADLRRRAGEAAAAAERSRLARDLHDAVTQTLFSASLIAEVLPRMWGRDPEGAMERLADLRMLTRGALAEMRTLLLELRPSALAESDLLDLVQQLVEATRGRTRIPVEFEVTGSGSVPEEVRLALYRIAQESLNNVSRHSGAEHAWVRLAFGEEGVDLEIRDDGRGFTVPLAPTDRLGLGIMSERAQDIGALLDVESAPGSGTRVRAAWRHSVHLDPEGD